MKQSKMGGDICYGYIAFPGSNAPLTTFTLEMSKSIAPVPVFRHVESDYRRSITHCPPDVSVGVCWRVLSERPIPSAIPGCSIF